MRTLLPIFSAIIISTLLITGCKKSSADNENILNPPPPTSGPGTTLAAVYFIDSTLAAPHDTVGIYKVSYDAFNRTSAVVELDYKPNGDTAYYTIQTLTYNGADTNAARRTKYSKSFSSATPSISRDTSFYIFSNGKCVYDSNAKSGSYFLEKYAYSGNNVLRSGGSLAYGNQTVHQSTIYQTLVNGNISYQVDTLVTRVNNVVNPAFFNYQRMEISASYTSNPNPFYQATKSFLRPFSYDDLGIASGAPPKNLITQIHGEMKLWGNGVSGNHIHDVNYTYVFRADGYPLIARQTIVTSGGTMEKIKCIFIYQ